MDNLIWISFVTACLMPEKAIAVRCYVCQSVTDPSCGDIFTVASDDPDLVQNCRTSCFKFTASRGDHREISRGCLPSLKALPNCLEDKEGDIYGKFCACNEDLCNVSPTCHESRVSLFMAMLIVSLLIVK